MSNKDDPKELHSESDDNVIPFPQPSASGGEGGEEDVADESPPVFYFVPDWDTDGDDSPTE